jgi:hypothetical protein
MIWFRCKQCGKTHNRPEGQGGAMIFCDCGQGLRVPWASTVPEPESIDEAIPIPLDPGSAVPVPKALPVPVPMGESAPARRPSIPLPANPPSLSAPRGHRPYRKVDPGFCLNHDEIASTHTCADCRLPFCDSCVVSLNGALVCGPCKNFRLRSQTRPTRVSPLAIIGLVVAVVSGPVAVCLSVLSLGSNRYNPEGSITLTIVLAMLGMIFPAGAMVLCGLALRTIDSRPNVGGRGMAMTGLVTGLTGLLWNLTIGMLVIVKHIQG